MVTSELSRYLFLAGALPFLFLGTAHAFGLFVLVVGRSAESFAGQAMLCVPLATAVAAVYVAIGLKYWFRTPIAGCALSLMCLVVSRVLL